MKTFYFISGMDQEKFLEHSIRAASREQAVRLLSDAGIYKRVFELTEKPTPKQELYY